METADIISIIEAAGIPAYDGAAFSSKRYAGAYVFLYPAAYREVGPAGTCDVVTWTFKITVVAGDEATVRGYADTIRNAIRDTSGVYHADKETSAFRNKSLWIIEITGRKKEWST